MKVLLVACLLAAMTTATYAADCNADLLTVEAWKIEPIDGSTNSLTVDIRSASDRPIRMVDGVVGFRDALGGSIATYAIDRDATIPAAGTFTETGRWGPYTFERLLKLQPNEVQAYTCVRSVLYEDGDVEKFE